MTKRAGPARARRTQVEGSGTTLTEKAYSLGNPGFVKPLKVAPTVMIENAGALWSSFAGLGPLNMSRTGFKGPEFVKPA